MQALCTAGGICCLLYYLVIICYAGISADFAVFWPAAGIALIVWGQLSAHGFTKRIPSGVRIVLKTGLGAGCLLFLILLIMILRGMRTAEDVTAPYVIVLGAQVKGKDPSRSLKYRIDRAYAYFEAHPETILVLSGGQGADEEISEAACMKNELVRCGVPAGQLILEERSTSTLENLRFSDELTLCRDKTVGIISNNFHICRALVIARRQGYRDAAGIPASSDPVMIVHFTVREVFALARELVRRPSGKGG